MLIFWASFCLVYVRDTDINLVPLALLKHQTIVRFHYSPPVDQENYLVKSKTFTFKTLHPLPMDDLIQMFKYSIVPIGVNLCSLWTVAIFSGEGI